MIVTTTSRLHEQGVILVEGLSVVSRDLSRCGSKTASDRMERESVHVLVVEDEADIAALVAYQLAQAGYGVRTASTGSEALRAIELDPPDLIVLDLLLPEVSGFDILKSVRGETRPRFPLSCPVAWAL